MPQEKDAQSIAYAGADAIGLVFYEPSPRFISIEAAQAIQVSLPPFISVVGLFVNAEHDYVNTVLDKVALDVLQFHGDEPESVCLSYNIPYIKAVRMSPETNYATQEKEFKSAKALLLDTYVEGQEGGTGQVFDWAIIPENRKKPVILAGGLNAGNVGDAIRVVNPFAVDVSGGVESTKGQKDEIKVNEFIKEVENVRV